MELVQGDFSFWGGEDLFSKPQIIIGERDRSIIRFLMEMKFATLDQMFRKFFQETRDGESTNLNWCRTRIKQLETLEFVRSLRSFYGGRSLYLPSKKGTFLVGFCFLTIAFLLAAIFARFGS